MSHPLTILLIALVLAVVTAAGGMWAELRGRWLISGICAGVLVLMCVMAAAVMLGPPSG